MNRILMGYEKTYLRVHSNMSEMVCDERWCGCGCEGVLHGVYELIRSSDDPCNNSSEDPSVSNTSNTCCSFHPH